MNVYPLVWRFPVPLLGHIEITGYGIMMMVGFLMGGWLIALELRRRGLHEEYAADITVAAGELACGGGGDDAIGQVEEDFEKFKINFPFLLTFELHGTFGSGTFYQAHRFACHGKH